MAKTSDVFTYDLLSRLRRDPKKANDVRDAIQRVEMISRAIKEGKASRSDLEAAQSKLIPLCNFNFGLLMPYFFPRYPIDKPLSLVSRPFMFSMTCLAPDSMVTLKAGRQVGKCVTGDTEVVLRGGTKMSMVELFDQGTIVSS